MKKIKQMSPSIHTVKTLPEIAGVLFLVPKIAICGFYQNEVLYRKYEHQMGYRYSIKYNVSKNM